MSTTLEDALTRCAELRAKLQASEHDRTEMAEALRAIVDCPDYRNISTHEMRNARSLLARLEGGEK